MIYINRTDSLEKLHGTYLWGAGKFAENMLSRFGDEIAEMNIRGFIDNCELKTEKIFCGYQVYAPKVLEYSGKYHIIIMCNCFNEIVSQIKEQYSENVYRCESYHFFIKYRLLARYQSSQDPEIRELLTYIRKESLQVFNYPFVWDYYNVVYEIAYDREKKLFYAVFQGKRMYLCKRYRSREQAEHYLRQIMMEQDKDSPHCYLTDDFNVENDAVVLDAGVAEGNFALSVIDKVKKIYLVEPDVEWLEALRYTFEPYMDKVVLIGKYLSNYQSEETVTVDSIVEETLDFFKLDIEGEEYYALQGASGTIMRSNGVKCAVCTYHNEFDYLSITSLLLRMGFQVGHSRGYMWFPYDKDYFVSLPTFRRGLVKAEKIRKHTRSIGSEDYKKCCL